MKDSIEVRLKKILLENSRKNIDINEINEETLLVEDLKFDSINFIDFIVALEQEFSISLNESDFLSEEFNKVGCIIEYITRVTD